LLLRPPGAIELLGEHGRQTDAGSSMVYGALVSRIAPPDRRSAQAIANAAV
jgi:hypothetical protein